MATGRNCVVFVAPPKLPFGDVLPEETCIMAGRHCKCSGHKHTIAKVSCTNMASIFKIIHLVEVLRPSIINHPGGVNF